MFQYTPLKYFICYQSPGRTWSINSEPLSSTIQSVYYLSGCPLPRLYLWNKNTVGDSVENPAKVHINYICISPLFPKSHYFITEVSQAGQAGIIYLLSFPAGCSQSPSSPLCALSRGLAPFWQTSSSSTYTIDQYAFWYAYSCETWSLHTAIISIEIFSYLLSCNVSHSYKTIERGT